MAEKVVSPGVFTNELDQSFLPAAIGEIGAAIIGPTAKGPALTPTVVSSFSEFEQKFGTTVKSGSNYYSYLTSLAAQNYLRHGNKLTVVRILGDDYSYASASIGSGVATVAGTDGTGSIEATANFGTDVNDEYQITVGSTEYRFIATDDNIPEDTSPVYFYPTGSNLAGALDNLRDEINNAFATVGVSASNNSNTHLDLTSSISNTVTVDTGSGTTFSDATFVGGGTSLGGGTSGTSGTAFQLNTVSDGQILNSAAPGLTPVEGDNNVLPSGSKDNIRYEISSVNSKKGVFSLLIRAGNDTIKRKQVLETWNNLSLDPTAPNYIEKIIGSQTFSVQTDGTTSYIQPSGDYPAKSKYVWVSNVDQTPDYLDENGNLTSNVLSSSLPTVGSGSAGGAFQGASDGNAGPNNVEAFWYDNITSTNNTAIQGYNISTTGNANGGSAYNTALNLLSNADEYDINLLMLPGVTNDGGSAIVNKAITTCEDRGDCFVIADPVGYGANMATAIGEAENYDSNYAAMYWPWVQVQDQNLGRNVWVPPSVVLGGIYAFNDKVAHPWFAPAGLNRGGIDTAIQAERKLTHGNRDDMYEANLNPIATFPGQGVTVFGQKTLQKKSSALDRVNVRRLMIKVKKFIAASSRFLVFEQNNTQTRRRFLNIANPYLEQVQSNSGLNAFKVVMDDTNNTPDVVDRNILYGQIFLQPTRTAEFIVLDFTIQPTGATFPE